MQRFHLLKLLQLPPEGNGRYICAGRFVTAAKEVGLPINHFTTTLNAIQGRLHRYWRVGTTIGKTGASFWQMMRDRSCVAVGWPKLGDISWVDGKQEPLAKLKTTTCGGTSESIQARSAGIVPSLLSSLLRLAEGDIVLAADGMSILGIGRVVGGYEYHSEFEFPHQRQVEWLTVDEWQMPESGEGLQSTVRELGKFNENILAIERRIQSPSTVKPVPEDDTADNKSPRPTVGHSGPDSVDFGSQRTGRSLRAAGYRKDVLG